MDRAYEHVCDRCSRLCQGHQKHFYREPRVIVQAFTVPRDQHTVESSNGPLRLTHEVYSSRKMLFAMIRNSVVDLTAARISVKLLHRDWKYDGPVSTCITLTLDRPSWVSYHPCPSTSTVFLSVVTNRSTTTSAFATRTMIFPTIGMRGACSRGTSGVMKFTIDVTKDPCVVVFSGFSADEWDDIAAD